jgi:predicted ester cyclase
MGAEHNETLVRRLIADVFNGHDLSGLEALLAPDLVSTWQGSPPLHGIAAWRDGMDGFFAAFPDAVYTLDDLFCTEHRGAWRGHWHATQRGQWQGVAPSGREVAWDVIIVGRFADGKLAEDWVAYDRLGLFQQLGELPLPRDA